MVNSERIVPIQKIDFLSMIGTVMKIANVSYAVLASSDVEGNFKVTGTGDVGNALANQPLKTLDFGTGVTAGVVYFVPAFDFEKITVVDVDATISDSGIELSEIKKDGITLYKATLSSGSVILNAVTPV